MPVDPTRSNPQAAQQRAVSADFVTAVPGAPQCHNAQVCNLPLVG